jgi:hypothetical protein
MDHLRVLLGMLIFTVMLLGPSYGLSIFHGDFPLLLLLVLLFILFGGFLPWLDRLGIERLCVVSISLGPGLAARMLFNARAL